MKIGYFLSSEEWGPGEQLEQARMAEEAGFEALWISDHYHPWNDAQEGIGEGSEGVRVRMPPIASLESAYRLRAQARPRGQLFPREARDLTQPA